MLYGLLDQHPEIYMAKPVRPEPKYFISNTTGNYQHYLDTVFGNRPMAGFLGEKSTSYYEMPIVAKRIKNCIPKAKFIFIMRNPVQRALSNYRFSKQNGFESRSLNEVFIQELDVPKNGNISTSVDPFDYLGRGEYMKHIKSYTDLFGMDSLLPIVFEDLIGNNELEPIWEFLKLPSIQNHFGKSFRNESRIEEVDNEIIAKLVAHFQQKNNELADFIGLDLRLWETK